MTAAGIVLTGMIFIMMSSQAMAEAGYPGGGESCSAGTQKDGLCWEITVNGVTTKKCKKASANQDCTVSVP